MSYRMFLLAGVLAAAVPVMYGQDLLDPATLQMGTGVSCSGGCSSSNGTDPVRFGATATMDIFQNTNGADTLTSGNFGLILAVPIVNGVATGTPSGTITETDYDSSQTLTDTGTATLSKTGTLNSGGDLYAALGISGENNSNSFGNLTGGESTYAGLSNVQSFNLYEYTVTGSSLVQKGYAQFLFGAELPLGTIGFGYGSNSKVFGTPWTESGLVTDGPITPTPEPADAVLLATMILGCGLLARRRYRFAGRK